jgi:hypothetical protein
MPRRNIKGTSKKDRFIEVYDGKNIKAAAKKVGMNYAYARKLATKESIIEKTKARRKKQADKVGIEKEKLLQEYIAIGFSNICNYFTVEPDGEITAKSFDDIPPEYARLIKSIQQDIYKAHDKQGSVVSTHTRLKIELWDKMEALRMIARYTGGFDEKRPPDNNTFNFYQQIAGGLNGDSPEKLKADLDRDVKILFPKGKESRF